MSEELDLSHVTTSSPQIRAQIDALQAQRVPDRWYGYAHPRGWDALIIELDEELSKIDPDYQLLQCKEKFAGLRYYITSSHMEEMREVIKKYEQRSYSICQRCGLQPAQMRRKSSGWYVTWCDDCVTSQDPQAVTIQDEEED